MIRRELEAYITRNRIPGIQYTVVDAQDVLLEEQVGFADLLSRRPVTAQTTFMASSSTKLITAAAVMQLVELQKLELDQSLSAYYPAQPYTDRVTIRHLLAQRSGIPNPLPLKWLHHAEEHETFHEERALQEILKRHPKLMSTPGEKYSYSNISYWLLGKAVESASGQAFADYIRNHVLNPLGIESSAASFQIENFALHAIGYQRAFSLVGVLLYLLMDRRMLGKTVKGHRALRPVYMNGPAYGGLICTATGFALFLQDLLRPKPRIFSAETRDTMLNQGFGWRTSSLENERYYGKPGGGPGFRSNVRLYPRLGLGVAWLANETGINEKQMNSLSDAIDRRLIEERARAL